MKNVVRGACVVGMALVLAGCIPEDRIAWAPDGQCAAIYGGKDAAAGLHLCDASGKLYPQAVSNVDRVAWLPDGREMVLACRVVATNWSELETALLPAAAAAVSALADEVAGGLGTPREWTNCLAVLTLENRLQPVGESALRLCLLAKHAEAIPVALRASWGDAVKAEIGIVQRADVVDWVVKAGEALATVPGAIGDLRVSSRKDAVAFTVVRGDNDIASYVTDLAGASPAWVVDEGTGLYLDWTPDGRSLVYAAVEDADNVGHEGVFGVIRKRAVTDDAGVLYTNCTAAGSDLATIAMQPFTKVRCLRDGRILFAAYEMALPAAPSDVRDRPLLYVMDPDRGAAVSRVATRKAEEEIGFCVAFFEVSPDEKEVVFAGDDKGAICRLFVDAGTVVKVPERVCPVADKVSPVQPVWRTSGELCFARRVSDAAGSNRLEIVRYAAGASGDAVVMSTNWPPALIDSLRSK